MSEQAEVWAGFETAMASALARDPGHAVAVLTQAYSPGKVREARRQRDQAVMLSAALTAMTAAPEPWVEPDEPGRPSCAWCGSAAPPWGLEDETLTLTSVEEYRCRDEASCMQRHDDRVPFWRRHQFPEWHERPAAEEPAWLTQLAEEAEVMLSGATVARRAMQAWLLVQEEARDGVVALAAGDQAQAPVAPVYYPPFDPQLGHWMHTLRNQNNRSYTLGYRLSLMPQAGSAADVPSAEAAPVTQPKPRRRRRLSGMAARSRRLSAYGGIGGTSG